MSDETRTGERSATFSELFLINEYRAIYLATLLSWIGDYVAKAAVTVLVWQQTGSMFTAAAAFGMTYVPWLLGGPLLAALAERHRYRTVMVACDLLRAGLVALVALPRTPVWLILSLMFSVALLGPPAQAARSAAMPLILTGDRLVLGIAVNQSTGQAAQLIGYMAGALGAAAGNPRLALLANAGTFTASAVILRSGLRDRPPAMRPEHRSHLLRETGQGFRFVFGSPALRAIAVLVFASMLFTIVPEGLAAGWAADLAAEDETRRGFYQGLIMVANPFGMVLGALLIARLLPPDRRRRLIRVFAVLAPMSLVPAVTDPGVIGIAVMAAACGFAVAGMIPASNALFVQALPNGFRARAFGVMQAGMQVVQGVAVFATGLLAQFFPVPVVVGLWSLAGVALLLFAASRWPSPRVFAAAVEAAERANAPQATTLPDGDRAAAPSSGPSSGRTATPARPMVADDGATA